MGSGVGFVGLSPGMRSFCFETPVECLWKLRRANLPGSALRSLRMVQVAPIPTDEGVALSIGGRF